MRKENNKNFIILTNIPLILKQNKEPARYENCTGSGQQIQSNNVSIQNKFMEVISGVFQNNIQNNFIYIDDNIWIMCQSQFQPQR